MLAHTHIQTHIPTLTLTRNPIPTQTLTLTRNPIPTQTLTLTLAPITLKVTQKNQRQKKRKKQLKQLPMQRPSMSTTLTVSTGQVPLKTRLTGLRTYGRSASPSTTPTAPSCAKSARWTPGLSCVVSSRSWTARSTVSLPTCSSHRSQDLPDPSKPLGRHTLITSPSPTILTTSQSKKRCTKKT